MRSPRRAPIFTLCSSWKDRQRRHLSNDAAQGRSLILVWRLLGILDFLDGATAHDITHLTRGSFHRRPGDVPAENGWNRIEFLQGVIPAATQTDSLGLFGMLPSGRAQLTGIPPCTHGPWHKCRQDSPEACSLPVVPLGAFRIPTIRHVSKGVALHEGP